MEEMNSRWYYSPDQGQLCQVIEARKPWGEMTCRVWLPWRKRNTKRMRLFTSAARIIENSQGE